MLENLLLRPLLTFLLKLCFRVEVTGLEHWRAAGDRVLILPNHQSFLDPMIIATFLPEKPAFAMNVFQADKWYFRWIERLFKIYRLDPGKPLSMKQLMGDLKKDAHVVLFPEGRITTSGGIMKIYDGARLLLEKTGATALPVRVDGAEYSRLSRMQRKLRLKWFPKIRVTILPPVRFEGEIGEHDIYDLMVDSVFATSPWKSTLLQTLVDACRWHGGSHVIAEDVTRKNMTYRQLFTRAFILREKLNVILRRAEGESAGSHTAGLDPAQALRASRDANIAILLPNSLGVMVTFVAVHMLDMVPCMLNFSAGRANILHACRIAQVKTVLTSRVFIEKGKLEPIIEALAAEHRVIYLEDIRPTVTIADKLRGLKQAFFLKAALEDVLAKTKPDAPAVVLYTSGSEGVPKGVVLSHANILANVYQATAKLDLNTSDIVFNAMPVFHSFGLSIGMLMPLMRGIKSFLYPTPLHFRVIPELVYDTGSTIMLGTDTFFNGYANYAHPYDFWTVRLAVAGAEKLKESTRRLWADRFMVNIMQGYGVTETSPAISFNTPVEHKEGTVGRIFPAMEWKLEPVEGLKEGAKLVVKGPNIMLGYLKADKPGVVQPQGEWYDTGDVVTVDADGFITIVGRAKRFAKISGEMVSLTAVEDLASTLMPDAVHAAIAIADERRGEQIVLYTESKELTREQVQAAAKEMGVPEIALPRQIIRIEEMPRLGNGKVDYPALAAKAKEASAA